jgi:hypothetical protein
MFLLFGSVISCTDLAPDPDPSINKQKKMKKIGRCALVPTSRRLQGKCAYLVIGGFSVKIVALPGL